MKYKLKKYKGIIIIIIDNITSNREKLDIRELTESVAL